MDRKKILAGEEIECDEMDNLILSNKQELTDEKTLKKVVNSIKDIRFADSSKNESGNERIRYTIFAEDSVNQNQSVTKKATRVAKNKAKQQKEEQTLTVSAYLDISDGKNINPNIKSPLVRNLKVICVWKPERIDGFSSFLKSIKND